ncbi:MBL fold metallo-hydrolase [Anoxybacteroides tepidamans]|uniref:MBL fold metallo-hydrolase n=1 Tax=Anoxybacteroides tepidamans TaxID=265948 RepID=UPI000485D429|nr:MBL fold metallo-hydrolase [Anoxybacillus tepidamans]
MKVLKVSPHIYKLESWFLLKMSAWIVRDDDGVYIVDTGMEFMGKRILKEAEKLGKLKGILLTHGHSDHVGGLKKILDVKKVPVYVHKHEIKYMEGKEPFPGRKKAQSLVPPGLVQPPEESDGGALKNIGNLIPFHTPGHVVYYHEKDRVLISGDLFTSKKGQLKPPIAMFTANMEEAIESARIVKQLNPHIVSICHGDDVEEPHKQIDKYLAQI